MKSEVCVQGSDCHCGQQLAVKGISHFGSWHKWPGWKKKRGGGGVKVQSTPIETQQISQHVADGNCWMCFWFSLLLESSSVEDLFLAVLLLTQFCTPPALPPPGQSVVEFDSVNVSQPTEWSFSPSGQTRELLSPLDRIFFFSRWTFTRSHVVAVTRSCESLTIQAAPDETSERLSASRWKDWGLGDLTKISYHNITRSIAIVSQFYVKVLRYFVIMSDYNINVSPFHVFHFYVLRIT